MGILGIGLTYNILLYNQLCTLFKQQGLPTKYVILQTKTSDFIQLYLIDLCFDMTFLFIKQTLLPND